jgi:hypothetical protein
VNYDLRKVLFLAFSLGQVPKGNEQCIQWEKMEMELPLPLLLAAKRATATAFKASIPHPFKPSLRAITPSHPQHISVFNASFATVLSCELSNRCDVLSYNEYDTSSAPHK